MQLCAANALLDGNEDNSLKVPCLFNIEHVIIFCLVVFVIALALRSEL